jgi:hypothetical protein
MGKVRRALETFAIVAVILIGYLLAAAAADWY